MSNKVAIISPARNEKYLPQTVESCLSNARGDVEFIAILEGYEPPEWASLQARFPNLHTIYHSTPKGMRQSINEGAASAISRGAKYLMKLDAHCMVPEGFDTILKADCDSDWIVVPRRKRLAPETWSLQDVGKPDIDYHYLSFPDDPNDFGGPGLNGKVWYERCRERAHIELDDEMSSQGSGWFMHAEYFQRMQFMDESKYGPFWNEFQELGLTCWLSGGQVKVNKRTWYAHWHKGKQGRGYSMSESWLKQGRNYTMNWLYNKASDKQTRPFSWLIEHFWPVPSWPANWEEMVYGGNKLNIFESHLGQRVKVAEYTTGPAGLIIHSAKYGTGKDTDDWLDVTGTLRKKIQNNSLDLMVTNSDLEVGNPFRGQKKRLRIVYSYDGGAPITKEVAERDWLIIGQSERYVRRNEPVITTTDVPADGQQHSVVVSGIAAPVAVETPAPQDTVAEAAGGGTAGQSSATVQLEGVGNKDDWEKAIYGMEAPVVSDDDPRLKASPNLLQGGKVVANPAALNDLLIRKFAIPSHRLRGPMPIEVPSFHRDDLASLLAELGFNRGAEIGVAEGKYSEVLVKANPHLHLLCVDPWHHYAGNPQGKSKEKNEYAFNECKRRLHGHKVTFDVRLSEDAVRDVPDGSLDFVYIDGHHGVDWVWLDIILWSRKVRVGGIVAGDDYYYLDPKRWGAGPVEAVRAYTEAHRINPWFIFNAHRSTDFLWVKQ